MAVHLPGYIETGHQYADVRTGNTGPPDMTLSNHGRKLCTLNGECETIGVFKVRDKGGLAALNSQIDVPVPAYRTRRVSTRRDWWQSCVAICRQSSGCPYSQVNNTLVL
jgi:hypothetical protein